MKVRILVNMVGTSVSYSFGQLVEVSESEGRHMLASGLAESVVVEVPAVVAAGTSAEVKRFQRKENR
jgi:hypothetical protein